jgi:hypothetical protein
MLRTLSVFVLFFFLVGCGGGSADEPAVAAEATTPGVATSQPVTPQATVETAVQPVAPTRMSSTSTMVINTADVVPQ